jgi:hypothetical protein
MHHLPGTRVLALVVGLAAAAAGSAYAQDTTETGQAAIDTTAPTAGAIDTSGVDTSATRDTTDTTSATDTSGVQNPPGYRGMERDTTMFPDSGGPPAGPGAVEDQATGTYDDSTWQDTTGAEQNPAGYRGMGRMGDTTAADTTAGGDTTTVGDTEPIEENTETPRLDPSENPAGGDTAVPAPDSTQ